MPQAPTTKPRRQPKQARSRASVEALLTATAQILVEEGPARATTNRIAARAGVGIGTLYHFFPSKEALMSALMTRHYERQWEVFAAALPEFEAGPIEAGIEALVRLMARPNVENRKLQRVLLEHATRLGQITIGLDIERRLAQRLHETLERHRDALRPKDLEQAAYVVIHTASSMFYFATVTAPDVFTPEAVVQEVTDLIKGYLLP